MRGTSNGTPVQVLLVDDDPADATLIQQALSMTRAAPRVQVAASGEQALTQLRGPFSQRPQIVILDLNLPGMNGHEILREIREGDEPSLIPVIILTTSSEPKDIEGAYRGGANVFVTKPNSLDGLESMVSDLERFWCHHASLPS